MGNYINVSQLQCPIRVLLVTGGDRLVISLKMTTNIYKTQFESQQYIRQYYSNVDREEQFFLTQLHELFSSFQSSSSPLSRPRVVLEIGSGPLVSGLVSASSWADLLIFSDLLEDNLRQIKLSLKQLSEASDANDAIFELESIKCIAHLEKIDVLKVQERMDQTPKIIAKCNLFSQEIITPKLLLPNSPSVIIIKLCLEFALDHVSQLTPVLTRVSNILSSGGKLVIMGALGESHYMVGGTRFPALNLTKEILEAAFTDVNGVEIETWSEMDRVSDQVTKPTGHSGIYFLVARKSQ